MSPFVELSEFDDTLLEVMMGQSADEVRRLELHTLDLHIFAFFSLARTDVDIIEVQHPLEPYCYILHL